MNQADMDSALDMLEAGLVEKINGDDVDGRALARLQLDALRRLRTQARQARGMSATMMAGMVARAQAELSGFKTPCVCDGCGDAHEKPVGEKPPRRYVTEVPPHWMRAKPPKYGNPELERYSSSSGHAEIVRYKNTPDLWHWYAKPNNWCCEVPAESLVKAFELADGVLDR